MGIAVIEMIDGRPPYFTQNPYEAMHKIYDGLPPRPKALHKVSSGLQGLLHSMLIREPSQRATAEDLLVHPFLQLAGPPECMIPLLKKRYTPLTATSCWERTFSYLTQIKMP
uniref:non-specific serine/threonine protein kinase n=1 Tax=Phascolarctos cinereus TaxID=38626 RepID=A0A6P5IYX8_PHACI|nr:serine/threonine-protein kinase PAK 5-like [Phascolarctos cinereus]